MCVAIKVKNNPITSAAKLPQNNLKNRAYFEHILIQDSLALGKFQLYFIASNLMAVVIDIPTIDAV